MSANNLTIQSILSRLNRLGGTSNPSKFFVRITKTGPGDRSYEEYVEFLCHSASLPGFGLTTDDIKHKGYGNINKHPYEAMFQDVNLSFIGDSQGKVFKYFHEWFKSIVNFDDSTDPNGTNQFGLSQSMYNFPDEYSSTVVVSHLSTDGEKIIEYTLYKAFPINISDIQVDWNSGSDFVKVPVTFTYMSWKTEQFERSEREEEVAALQTRDIRAGVPTRTVRTNQPATVVQRPVEQTLSSTDALIQIQNIGSIAANIINTSSSEEPEIPTQDDNALFTEPGTYEWRVPPGVSSISVAVIGGGGAGSFTGAGGGGALSFLNNITVTPGQVFEIVVGSGGSPTGDLNGENSSFSNLVVAEGGKGHTGSLLDGQGGKNTTGFGGDGGDGFFGGGGAGGYEGPGGDGSTTNQSGINGTGGSGGGGGALSDVGGGGGGVRLNGLGVSGVGGLPGEGGTGGSGGQRGSNVFNNNGGDGGSFGGGGGKAGDVNSIGGRGGDGAIQIIFPGNQKNFPSNL